MAKKTPRIEVAQLERFGLKSLSLRTLLHGNWFPSSDAGLLRIWLDPMPSGTALMKPSRPNSAILGVKQYRLLLRWRGACSTFDETTSVPAKAHSTNNKRSEVV